MNLSKANLFFMKGLVYCLLIFSFFTSFANEATSSNKVESSMVTCTGITITGGVGKITVVGYGNGLSQILVLEQPSYTQVYQCAYNCDNNFTEITLPEGEYYVKVVKYNSNYTENCFYEEYDVPVTSGSGCPQINVNPGPGQLTVTGYTQSSPTPHIKVFDSNWNLEDDCWGTGCPSGAFTVNGLSSGNHHVIVDFYNPNTCSSYFGTHNVPSSRIQGETTQEILTELPTPKELSQSGSEGQSIEFLKLMPNPARDYLTIKMDSPNDAHQVIRIYNMQGSLALQQDIRLTKGENQVQLDIANLPNGIYTLMPLGNTRQNNKARFVKL